jgi:hypothetical protein
MKIQINKNFIYKDGKKLKQKTSVFKYILYGLDSSVNLHAHNHLDLHQEDEELKCKPFHLGKLQFRQIKNISLTLNVKNQIQKASTHH